MICSFMCASYSFYAVLALQGLGFIEQPLDDAMSIDLARNPEAYTALVLSAEREVSDFIHPRKHIDANMPKCIFIKRIHT